jgi:ribosomal protein S6--L-glutamate ligase
VLEVNSSPGLEGIEEATGVDVAGRIIAYVVAAAGPVGRTRPPASRLLPVPVAVRQGPRPQV